MSLEDEIENEWFFLVTTLHRQQALAMITGKWKVRIIWHLLEGTKRFSELCRLLPGVNPGTLTYGLRQLEADGLIQRTQHATIPPTVEYALTIRGAEPKRVLLALSQWSEKNLAL